MISASGENAILPKVLSLALDDELRARATYRAVIEAHGPIIPFVNIVQAEQRHIDALLVLFARYGVPLPADSWIGQVSAPATLQQSCEAGVAAETSNCMMYDALLRQTPEPDVRTVFTNLRNASAYNHLPAFQVCAAHYGSATAPALAPTCRDGATTEPRMGPFVLGLVLGAGLIWRFGRQSGNG